MKIKWLMVVALAFALIACEKVSDYTISQVDRTDLSISSNHEALIHNLVFQIQSRNVEALKPHVTPEFHQKLISQPEYLDQLSSYFPHNLKLSKNDWISTSERILDQQDQSVEVVYQLSHPEDKLYLQITLLTDKNKSVVDNIEINKIEKVNDT